MSHDFIEIIKERGFVHQMTDEAGLRGYLSGPDKYSKRAYIGFDCTAPSLHVGSLVQIMLLRWWQKCGHQPIILFGGGTTKIGDPSGKDESRKMLSEGEIRRNLEGISKVFSAFIDPRTRMVVDNDAWLSKLNYIEFLRDIAPHFSVNRMMTMDSVKLRLEREQNLSLLEFNYMILQAYDFTHLNQQEGCRVQMGGSDQWGNIISGIDLNRRLGRPDVYGITSPLITTASGSKMGKTATGAVWLNDDLCSPYDYWQFWRNTEDADVAKFLKLFTELSLDEIAALTAPTANINDAKARLATEATALLHGHEAAEKAAQTARDIFSGSGISDNLPEYFIAADKFSGNGVALSGTLALVFGFSNSEARRLIKGGGISLNDEKVTDENHRVSQADFAQGFAKLSKGKKQHVLVKLA